jgi:hypothetical protein
MTPSAACAYSPRRARLLRGLFRPLGIGRPKFTIVWQLSSKPHALRLAAASRSVAPSRRVITHRWTALLVSEAAYSQKRIISGSSVVRSPVSGSMKSELAFIGSLPVISAKARTIH